MLRSFQQAARAEVDEHDGHEARRAQWCTYWYDWVSATFLRSYLETAAAAGTPFLPQTDAEIATLLDLLLLEQRVQELYRAARTGAAEVDELVARLRESLAA